MQKVADPADISVLFFSSGANFWVIFGPFWQFWVIFGLFWVILGHFWCLFFVAKYASVLFKSLFATLAAEEEPSGRNGRILQSRPNLANTIQH